MCQALGTLGAVFLPFVKGPDPFVPEGMGTTKEKSTDPSKMKPKELRNAQQHRNAALREAAFLGTLHLPVDYAGQFKSVTDRLRRARDRMMRNQTFLENKVPQKYKNFSYEFPVAEGEEEEDNSRPQGIIEMRMRHMMEKKWEIIIKCGPPKVQKAMQAAFDFKSMKWKKECKDKEAKQMTIENYWKSLWTTKESYVRNKREVAGLEKELEELRANTEVSHQTLLQDLCAKGCDVNAARDDDDSNFTALMCAARNGHLETVQALLELPDIDVNKVNKYGSNAMHYAAMYAHKEVCQALRAAKVTRNVPNCTGKTPKDLAMAEHQDLEEHKKKQWETEVFKGRKFCLVPKFEPKDKADDEIQIPAIPGIMSQPGGIYNKLFEMHAPGHKDLEPPKEWKPGRWRISTIPDPACKLDDFEEKDFMKRWKSTAKKLP